MPERTSPHRQPRGRRKASDRRGRPAVSNVIPFPGSPPRRKRAAKPRATSEGLYRALEAIPELGVEAGDFIVNEPHDSIPITVQRHFGPQALPFLHDRRLERIDSAGVAAETPDRGA